MTARHETAMNFLGWRPPRSVLFLAAALAAAACAKPPQERSCTSRADCAATQSCAEGVCQEDAEVLLVAPAAAVLTRGTVAVQVEVNGLAASSVQVLLDDVVVANLAPPFSTALDTTTFQEGVHTLRAAATLGGRTFRSLPVTLTIDRTAPASPILTGPPAFTNGAPVAVAGTAEAGASIQVLEGGATLGVGAASLQGAWVVTVDVAEGPHSFRATATDAAGNSSTPSPARDVTVDRTAPTLTARAPAPNATNVWSRDPITVTFSEPILGSTLGAATVTLTSGGAGVPVLPLALSNGGRTLTVKLDDGALPAFPASLSLSLLPGITDLAGNALAPSSWSFAAPEWQAPADRFFPNADGTPGISIAVGPDGAVHMAWTRPPSSDLLYQVTSSSGWSTAVSPDPTSSFSITDRRLVVDSTGRPVLAYVTGGKLYVSRREAGGWALLGGGIVNAGASPAASLPRLAIDSSDAPLVLWQEAGSGNLRRWSGSAWLDVTATLPSGVGDEELGLVGDQPRTSSASGPIATVGGAFGIGFGGTITAMSMAIDGTGTPVVAALAGGALKVFRFVNPPFGVQLGGNVGTAPDSPSLFYRGRAPAGQQLVLAYREGTSGPRVVGWTGSAWQDLSVSIATASGIVTSMAPVAANASGAMAIVWTETQYPTAWITVERYNR